MSRSQRTILELLLEHATKVGGWLYGLELVKRSDGRLGRATVYVHLDALEEQGHVESRRELRHPAVGLPRRQYRITRGGQRHLTELASRALAAAARLPKPL